MSSAAKRTAFLVIALLVPSAILGVGLARRLASPVPGSGIKIQISDKPIAMPAMVLKDLDGHVIDQAAWRGKVVLLNFWATWCGPCRAEIPSLIELQNQYRDQLIVVGLSIDSTSTDDVKAFVRENHMNYLVAMAGPDVEEAFGGVSAVPSTFVARPDGSIVTKHVGQLNPEVTEQEIRAFAGLPTAAEVEVVKDTGQLLLANAAFATEIPGVDLSALNPTQKAEALRRLNTDKCTCGCGLTLAQCRINDPTCDVSKPVAQQVAADVAKIR